MELQIRFLTFAASAQLLFLLGLLSSTFGIDESKLQFRESERAALLSSNTVSEILIAFSLHGKAAIAVTGEESAATMKPSMWLA